MSMYSAISYLCLSVVLKLQDDQEFPPHPPAELRRRKPFAVVSWLPVSSSPSAAYALVFAWPAHRSRLSLQAREAYPSRRQRHIGGTPHIGMRRPLDWSRLSCCVAYHRT